jgi:hypothetical protein
MAGENICADVIHVRYVPAPLFASYISLIQFWDQNISCILERYFFIAFVM